MNPCISIDLEKYFFLTIPVKIPVLSSLLHTKTISAELLQLKPRPPNFTGVKTPIHTHTVIS